jgi:flagellar basal-body rod protein FlgB
MFPSLFKNTTLESLEKTVAFAERRHSILAGNLANMDTPGYQARDLSVEDFQASLKGVFDAEKQSHLASPGLRFDVLQPSEEGLPSVREQAVENVHDAMRQVVYNDGSNDSLELQVTHIAKNQAMHNMAIALMRSQFKMLQMAISENVNV